MTLSKLTQEGGVENMACFSDSGDPVPIDIPDLEYHRQNSQMLSIRFGNIPSLSSAYLGPST